MKEQQATAKFGVSKRRKEDKQYELLLENQVDFIKSDLLEGMIEKKRRKHNDSDSE